LILYISPVETRQNQYKGEQEIFLSFRYIGGVSSVISAYTFEEKIYLPVNELFNLLLIYSQVNVSQLSISGFYLDSKDTYLLDLKNGRAEFNSIIVPLNASNYLIKELDFYLEPWVFEELFNLKFSVDPGDLVLHLQTSDILPIVDKEKRKRSGKQIDKAKSRDLEEIRQFKNLDRHLLSGGYLDYSSFSNFSNGGLVNNLNLSAGGEVFFGETRGNLALIQSPVSSQATFSNLRWRYVFMENPLITEISAGNHFTSGLGRHKYNGVKISNEPVNPPQSFDRYVIDDFTVSEAEIELYQNGKLVDITLSDAQGYYRFEIPLNYGSSDIKIKIYGPSGEIIESDRRIRVPFNFVPTKKTFYNLEVGQMRNDSYHDKTHRYLNTNIAFGINNNLTSRLGLQYHRSDNNKKPIVYNSLSARLATHYLLNSLYAINSFSRFSLQGNFSSGRIFNILFSNYTSQGYFNPASLAQSLNANVYYPFRLASQSHSFRFSLDNQQFFDREQQTRINIDLSTTIRKMRVKVGYKESVPGKIFADFGKNGNFTVSSVYSVPKRSSIKKLARGMYVRAEYQHSFVDNSPRLIGLQLVQDIKRWGKINFATHYNFPIKSYSAEIGFTYDFDLFRSSTKTRRVGGETSYLQTFRGSIGYDKNYNDFLFNSYHQVGRTSVSARMFLDENNSGSFDEGESILPGNALKIKKTSTRGILKNDIPRFTQLLPYKKYTFYFDESRIPNPMLSPTYKEFTFISDPNQYSKLDVPLRMTGIIDGKVYIDRGNGKVPLGGLRILLEGKTDDFQMVLKTFSDGSYYAMAIPPGNYDLSIDESQLQFLNAASIPQKINIKVQAKKDGDLIEGLEFILEPKN